MTSTRTATCMLCEAVCGLEVTVLGERLIRVAGDKLDPFSKGHICPKAAALEDVRTDPDRVTFPLRRGKDGHFTRASWDDALGEVADRLGGLIEEHGPRSVGTYVGNPLAHSYAGLMGSIILGKALGSHSRFSATSADQLPHMLASLEMFGHQALLPVPDLDRTKLLLVVGANPVVSNGSVMTAPGMKHRLLAIRARGGRVIVIDPRRTETAEIADEHFFIRPGADAFLLLAMADTILSEGLARVGRLRPMVRGMEALRAVAGEFPAEAVETQTGIAATDIRRLARDFAAADGAACYSRVGACTQEFGGLVAWLSLALDVVTGNLDRPGGRMFANPAADLVALASRMGMQGGFARFKSRVRGLPEFGGELPVATLAEEIETEGEGRIRGLLTMAGNPALSAPNGKTVARALEKLDFMVSIDLYKNETTSHASVILPPTFGLERDHYDLVLYALAVRNTARYAPKVFEPAGETRDDWDIMLDLASRLAKRRGLAARGLVGAIRAVGPRRLLDGMLRMGPYRLSLAKLEASPHGLDLGALEPRLPGLLGTRRHIDVAPRVFLEDIPRLREKLGAQTAAGLELIGRRQLRSNNSWMHNSERLTKGPTACTLLMHPDDAKKRGLRAGELVVVRSRTGEVRVPLAVSDEIAKGVVSLPHGWGHDRRGTELRVASSRAGASINDLTDEHFLDGLTGNAGFSGVRVEVTPAA